MITRIIRMEHFLAVNNIINYIVMCEDRRFMYLLNN